MTKLESAILYFLKHGGEMTRDKLECLLYFADFGYFEKYEKPLFKNVRWIKGKNYPELRLSKREKENEKENK